MQHWTMGLGCTSVVDRLRVLSSQRMVFSRALAISLAWSIQMLDQPPWSNMFRTLRNAACSTCNGNTSSIWRSVARDLQVKRGHPLPYKDWAWSAWSWVLQVGSLCIWLLDIYIHICTIPINSIQYSNPQKIEKCFQNVFDHVICTSHFQVSHLLFSI